MRDQNNQPKKLWISLIFGASLVLAAVLLSGILRQPQQRKVASIPLDLQEKMTYHVIQTYPHDPEAFTQGLIYLDGFLYESTGLYGRSSLRKVDLETGEVLQIMDLAPDYFAEGLTDWSGNLIQLTWREQTGFVYRQDDFTRIDQFTYAAEGWGLTHNDDTLIMSDGSEHLIFLDPETFQETDRLIVLDKGQPIAMLNELEVILGEVFANIWLTDTIVRIDPETGEVNGWLDLSGLLPEEMRTDTTDVLNGIAYDPEQDRLFVTGKLWPLVFEIELVPLP
jgi:glutaminyl-peptide cyclotransferase